MPAVGEKAVEEDLDEIKAEISGFDVVIITAGLGGGTGTGGAPLVSEAAREVGAVTISVVTLPFSKEGERRRTNAEARLERLREKSDTVITIPNDRLLDHAPSVSVAEGFKIIDQVSLQAIETIKRLSEPAVESVGYGDLNYEAVQEILENGGAAMMSTGESDSEHRAQNSIRSALRSQLVDADYAEADSAIIKIDGGPEMDLAEIDEIVTEARSRLNPTARIVWGASIDEELEGKIQTTLVVTGIDSSPEPLDTIDTIQ